MSMSSLRLSPFSSALGPLLSRPSHPQEINISVWWDYTSCPVPHGTSSFKIFDTIVSALRSSEIYGTVSMKAFGMWQHLPASTQDALLQSGITLVHVNQCIWHVAAPPDLHSGCATPIWDNSCPRQSILRLSAFSSALDPLLSRPSHPQEINIFVWWDYTSCPIPHGTSSFEIFGTIVSALRSSEIYDTVSMKAFGMWQHLPTSTQDALLQSGITLVHVNQSLRSSEIYGTVSMKAFGMWQHLPASTQDAQLQSGITLVHINQCMFWLMILHLRR
ncbi:hypothetical protein FCM35_KLT01969 [Carex littledalei]|uniref:NYN domain-containing protein n=1 Tax=Carex littledalei TaxID=544730 RepID=A0A833R620_9POAL|nr:hypothetical protein FCM35_KLT01969 [Carex littledalei]